MFETEHLLLLLLFIYVVKMPVFWADSTFHLYPNTCMTELRNTEILFFVCNDKQQLRMC